MEVYMDNAATTKVLPEIMQAVVDGCYGNPSSLHTIGQNAASSIQRARKQIASIINCDPSEIYFTSGGTESDNWAIRGIAHAHALKGKHIITTQIEHHAILNSCKLLEDEGFKITYLPVQQNGILDPRVLKEAITPDTILISIMSANNEIGTIQPIEQCAKIAHENNIIFHTDAVQGMGNLQFDVQKQGIDLLSVSGHKFHALKGIGFLYKKKDITISPLIVGGQQENYLRAGTENVPGILSIAKALELCYTNFKSRVEKKTQLRDYIINRVMDEIPYVFINGDLKQRLCNNINISFKGVEGESILNMLNQKNIYISAGAACASGSLEPSHVLTAINVPNNIINNTIRISLSEYNTFEEADYVCDQLKEAITFLRKINPNYKE